ncbi:MAG: tetratricopeptide repeat protein [Candidatus Aureabacteria bacterium]|nr:tetratricopeptide repeat protein [Candidatus Auribacterota bacterium]
MIPVWRFRLCLLGLMALASLCHGGPPAGEPLTEFLVRWDQKYRLIDPEVEPAPRAYDRDYAAAASDLKKAILTGIADDEMYYRLGFCYEKLGDLNQALDSYRRAAAGAEAEKKGSALEPAIRQHLGMVYARKGMWQEAAGEFEKALAGEKESFAMRNNLGYCYRQLSMRRKALAEFRGAIALNPRSAEALLNSGIICAELGELDSAENYLRKAIELNPNIDGGRYTLGMVLETKGGAMTRAPAAVSPAPHATTAASPLAAAPLSEGDSEEALLTGARGLMEKGDRAGAERLYRGVIGKDHGSTEAYLGMARIKEYAKGERYGEGFPAEACITYYRTALTLAPDQASAWFDLGNVFEKIGRLADATAAFEKAYGLDPGMKVAAYNLGLCYSRLGRGQKAEDLLREAIRKDNNFAEAHFQLARLLAEKRDYGDAIQEYEETLRIAPDDADAHYNLAQILRLHAERPEKAAVHLKEYLKCRPDAGDAAEVREWIREVEAGKGKQQ